MVDAAPVRRIIKHNTSNVNVKQSVVNDSVFSKSIEISNKSMRWQVSKSCDIALISANLQNGCIIYISKLWGNL